MREGLDNTRREGRGTMYLHVYVGAFIALCLGMKSPNLSSLAFAHLSVHFLPPQMPCHNARVFMNDFDYLLCTARANRSAARSTCARAHCSSHGRSSDGGVVSNTFHHCACRLRRCRWRSLYGGVVGDASYLSTSRLGRCR